MKQIHPYLQTQLDIFKKNIANKVKERRKKSFAGKKNQVDLETELNIRAMKCLVQCFSPYLKDMVGDDLKLNFFEKNLSNKIINLLSNPNDVLGRANGVTNFDASNLVRVALLEQIQRYMDNLQYWNDIYPKATIGKKDPKRLEHSITENLLSAQKRFTMGKAYSSLHYMKRYSKIGMAVSSSGIGLLAASAIMGTITATIFTIGIVAIGTLTVSAITYLWTRHKKRKADRAIKEFLVENLAKKASTYQLDDQEGFKQFGQALDKMAFGKEYEAKDRYRFDRLGDDVTEGKENVFTQSIPDPFKGE